MLIPTKHAVFRSACSVPASPLHSVGSKCNRKRLLALCICCMQCLQGAHSLALTALPPVCMRCQDDPEGGAVPRQPVCACTGALPSKTGAKRPRWELQQHGGPRPARHRVRRSLWTAAGWCCNGPVVKKLDVPGEPALPLLSCSPAWHLLKHQRCVDPRPRLY